MDGIYLLDIDPLFNHPSVGTYAYIYAIDLREGWGMMGFCRDAGRLILFFEAKGPELPSAAPDFLILPPGPGPALAGHEPRPHPTDFGLASPLFRARTEVGRRGESSA